MYGRRMPQDQRPKITYEYSRNLDMRHVTIKPERGQYVVRTMLSCPQDSSGWPVLVLREFDSQHRPEGTAMN